ncbi:hypothetical protein EXIGLDRAFT_736569 [Exidia glandulosa HHB12029]|uniref:Uncharacterized protein n=1 Tax=Exidia glandulosa HHB12029 TaxID=1314781 RepID=A0A165Z2H4_EXIGL|nr:hypothetical protein EXIGLDRAFT_736569 [Exidia glandulosa HHB12029]
MVRNVPVSITADPVTPASLRRMITCVLGPARIRRSPDSSVSPARISYFPRPNFAH